MIQIRTPRGCFTFPAVSYVIDDGKAGPRKEGKNFWFYAPGRTELRTKRDVIDASTGEVVTDSQAFGGLS